jgi:hypothetical protein
MINNPISSVLARLARVILIGIFLASSNALAEPASEPITIWSDGVQLAGDLW